MSNQKQSKVIFYVKLPNGCGFMVSILGNGKIHAFSLDKKEMLLCLETKQLFDNLEMEHEPIINSIFTISRKKVEEIAVKVVAGEDLIELFLDYEEEYKEDINDGVDDWDDAETLSQNG